MLESLDDGVGRILALLEKLKIDDETVVIFKGDNGGLTLDLSEWGPDHVQRTVARRQRLELRGRGARASDHSVAGCH